MYQFGSGMGKKVNVKKMERACVAASKTLKALSHPQRLLVLGHLLSGEQSVSSLVERCTIPQSQMSLFLIRMKSENLVSSRREGKYQYYSIKDKKIGRLIKIIQDMYCEV